ncbi:MAG: hypothetical protein Q4D13_04425 [Erysipelotrichaceae bacterium]|nr:hypothetical protein [Erysipelotrichaceae bacterium]
MKIVLVCMSAITTNILAVKLQKYAEDNKYDDRFMPCKVNFYKDMMSTTDIFLLAPQAVSFKQQMEEDCKAHNIPLIVLDERDFVLQDIEKIYSLINLNRKTSVKEDKPRLSITTVRKISLDAFISVLPIIVLGIILYVINRIMNNDLLGQFTDITWGLSGLYLLLTMAYQYGKNMNKNPISVVMLMTMTSFILLPVMDFNGEWNTVFRTGNHLIDITYFSFPYILLDFLMGLFVIQCLDLIDISDKNTISSEFSFLPGLKRNSIVIIIAMIIRIALQNLF